MRHVVYTLLLPVVLISVLASGCKQREEVLPDSDLRQLSASSSQICGQVTQMSLKAWHGAGIGTVSISNDADNIYVQVETSGEWLLHTTRLFVGSCDALPVNPANIPMLNRFPYVMVHGNAGTQHYTFTVPKTAGVECPCVSLHSVAFRRIGARSFQLTSAWGEGIRYRPQGLIRGMFADYCIQQCAPADPGPGDSQLPTCSVAPGSYISYTQSAWGDANSPAGQYLLANFNQVFPNGLTVGCGTNTVTFTSAQAIIDALPSSNPPSILSGSSVDPAVLNNEFVAWQVALKLMVAFDDTNPSMNPSPTPFGDLVLTATILQGSTVRQVMQIGDQVLGGCSPSFTPTRMAGTLESILQNFQSEESTFNSLGCPPLYN
jgi:hypothetical protein